MKAELQVCVQLKPTIRARTYSVSNISINTGEALAYIRFYAHLMSLYHILYYFSPSKSNPLAFTMVYGHPLLFYTTLP